MKTHHLLPLLTAFTLIPNSTRATERVPQWPLRNGDFSIITGRVIEPMPQAYWQTKIQDGEHSFSVDPQPASPSFDADASPASAIITTTKIGLASWEQAFPLEPGRYRLSVQVAGTNGSMANIGYTSRMGAAVTPVKLSPAFKTVTLQMRGGGSATVKLFNSHMGTVKFRNVKVEAITLESSVIPTVNAVPIGGIVLPPNPTPAEKYACYQLQHFVYRITGRTPGLLGRDPVFPGRLVYIGRSAANSLKVLKGRPVDSYLVGSTGKEIILAGNNDEATLYAVYDFLKQQGCRWITPGVQGEVVPRKSKLTYAPLRQEIPDFDVRGGLVSYTNFSDVGYQQYVSVDDHLDWALRNRENAVWLAYGKTSDMGAHRGHGWIQGMNHSYNLTIAPGNTYFKDHPDWYPLVKGVRMAKDANGGPTQLCVSSQGLRDYTVKLALQYFKDNPNSKIFAMHPNDGVSFWCECANCKALDGPGIDWSKNGIDSLYMTDRALNYTNYVAREIAKVYTGRMVTMYAYGCTRDAPSRTRVEKNVLIHYCRWGGPLNKPFEYSATPNRFIEFRKDLDGWKKAGAKEFVFYNYLDWYHQDAPIFWSNHIVTTLRGLKEHYNFRGRIGETETSQESSPTFYAVMTAADWNTKVDYKAIIKDTCDKFYGKAAATMYAYNIFMDRAVMTSTTWKDPDTVTANQYEFLLPVLEEGRLMLEKANKEIEGDALLEKRIAQARFSHAYLTYCRAINEPRRTAETDKLGREAFTAANSFRKKYGVRVWWPTFRDLQTLKMEPTPGDGSHVQDLPLEWNFKTDAKDEGLKAGWPGAVPDTTWTMLRINTPWTAQGYDYHGVAWYSTSFTLPADVGGTKLSLYFGAVDGYCDVYLDGEKIGEQKSDLNSMWDQPFRIELPANLGTAPHRLTVRVQKENYAAGIWKKVSIVKTDAHAVAY